MLRTGIAHCQTRVSAGMLNAATLRHEGNEIVFANTLQDEKGRRRVACIGDEVRAPRRDREGLAWAQSDIFLGLLEINMDHPLEHIERVADIAMRMPGHLLRGTDLQLSDAKAGTRSVIGAAFHLVESACILHGLRHGSFLHDTRWSRIARPRHSRGRSI